MIELDPGRLVGSYRVVRCIGQGAMGTVYEVEHLDLGVRYALKTFSFDPSDEHAEILKAKFLEEGKLLARLKHPNLTHVFDLAYDAASESLYFVMDLVTYEDGESYTAEDIDPADIDEELVYKWFRELASALDYIHAEGIVHRDIKPANLLVDKDLNVILTDFGISHIFGERAKAAVEVRRTVVTKTGRGKLVMGTEKYMAPEVAAGGEVTPAADAYALGVMTLRWLTGFFYGDNPGALALLSKKKYRWLSVLPKLLAPAERRPKTYSELVRQLKPLAVDWTAPKRPVAQQAESRSLVRTAVASAFAAAFLGGAGWFGWQAWQRYETDRQANAARLAAIQRQMEEQAKRQPMQVTNTVVKVVEREKKVEKIGGGGERTVVSDLPREQKRGPVKTQGEEWKVQPAAPKAEKMVIVQDAEEETKDYGPIPDVTYRWFAGKGNDYPQKVDFQMANGAKIEMMPMKKGVFYMSNNWDDKKARHKVTLTRPFWVSKYCVTTTQWREFDAEYVKDCLPIEKALEGKYPLSKMVTRPQFDAFCKFLTQKYRKQIPEGYVFRLPSEAEWEYALDLENTFLRYRNPTDVNWCEATRFDGPNSRDSMLRLVRERKLDALAKWYLDKAYGWTYGEENRLFVGGRLKPMASGICDVMQHATYLLDTIEDCLNRRINYFDEETDPLRFVTSKGKKALSVARAWEKWREFWGFESGRHIQHVVLGPDLIRERAWENARKNVKNDVQIPSRQYSWDPNMVPKIIKKPKELTFKMAEGGDMVFCTIPAGTFNMSNPDGQDKLYHKVTLTKPFWITKYCVTAKQWREFAKCDCEGVVRQVEKVFPKNPIYMPFARSQWDGFCEFLNKRYGHQLPKGYVFRLPTEAEWEWAFVGEKKGDIRKMPRNRFFPEDLRFKNEFSTLLKRQRTPKMLSFNASGFAGDGAFCIYVGGRVECTDTFGVCDMVIYDWKNPYLFDTLDIEENFCQVRTIEYDDCEIDPVRYAGRLASRNLVRSFNAGRSSASFDRYAYAHLVVGPDIESQLKKDLDSFPDTDFGGSLLSDVITHGGLSSSSGPWLNAPERFASLISRENKLKMVLDEHREFDGFGFETRSEDSPWIQLNMDKLREIAGVQIDALSGRCYHRSRHLRVWWSDDGKVWREVAAEDQRKHRYRFDLQRKNVKAKYIRIGREPGFLKDYFSLDKILIYGK